MSELSELQWKFARLLPRLIDHAYELGYTVTLGEAWRTPEQAAINAAKGTGIKNSLHIDRLAIDLNLFKGGLYLTDSEGHRPLGEWWETVDPDCRWGGRFNDPNHYSITYEGRK